MRRYAILIAALTAMAIMGAAIRVSAQTAPEILERLDANESYRSISYSARMEITIGGETRYKTMDTAALGSDKAFVEFTNPEDRGTRYLKLGKDLWIYFPKEQDSVKISGHLLKEGVMGSDLSYEDALESQDYGTKYSSSLKGKEEVDGRSCFVVELAAKAPEDLPKGSSAAAYERRLLWIDAERYVALKEQMYARSGMLLKEERTLEVQQLGSRWFPVKSEFESKIRAGTKTVLSMTKVKLDADIDPRKFTMAALRK